MMLLDSAMKVSLLVLLAVTATFMLRRRSAALRHWVLAVAVACAWAVIPLSWVLPPWFSAHAPAFQPSSNAPPDDAGVAVEFVIALEPSVPRRTDAGLLQAVWSVWIVGSLATALTLFVGLARLRWLARHARVIDEGPCFEFGEQVRRATGLRSPVRILQSDRSDLLIAWGWRRPKILLPAAASDWSGERLRIVLTHELAHVARGDWIVQLGAEALRAAYWFNPLLWIVCRRLRAESERACDDAVLSRGIEGHEYAAHLLAVARSLHPRRRCVPAPAMARPSSLERRIRAMLDTTLNRRPLSRPHRVVSIAALLALTLFLAGLRAQPQFYSLTGTVLDPTNRVLPDAALVLTNTASEAKYEVRSDASGRYEFVGLPPATYSLHANVPGFAPLSDRVDVSASVRRDLRLRLGSLQETVTVVADSAPPAPPDAAALRRQEEARRRRSEIEQRGQAFCAGGGPATSVGGNILVPFKVRHVAPTYPEHLRAAGVVGTVRMDAVIGMDGMVRDVQVTEGIHPELDAAAADALRGWQFTTTLLNCEPVEVSMRVTTHFKLQR